MLDRGPSYRCEVQPAHAYHGETTPISVRLNQVDLSKSEASPLPVTCSKFAPNVQLQCTPTHITVIAWHTTLVSTNQA